MAPKSGIHISLEGISGCGKSFMLEKLREAMPDALVVYVQEIEDRNACGLQSALLTFLHSHGDHFLRTGHPCTETLLLMALKTYDAETVIGPALSNGSSVIEDRSLDTVAIYQALVLHPGQAELQLQKAAMIYQQLTSFRRAPDLTFWIDDAFETAIERAQRRSANGYSLSDVAVLREADALYRRYAGLHQDRIIRLDRRLLEVEDIVQTIREVILSHQR
ncbi:MAG TPA: hypothetical protein VKR06_34800 [Ktedonosporobacter sp.]|nr:hypothetical protein [Ktedonosporobacter sp.]